MHGSTSVARQEPSPALVSEQEAARYLGISPRKLFDLAADPACGINAVRLGRRKLYSVSALSAWIEGHSNPSAGEGDPSGS